MQPRFALGTSRALRAQLARCFLLLAPLSLARGLDRRVLGGLFFDSTVKFIEARLAEASLPGHAWLARCARAVTAWQWQWAGALLRRAWVCGGSVGGAQPFFFGSATAAAARGVAFEGALGAFFQRLRVSRMGKQEAL